MTNEIVFKKDGLDKFWRFVAERHRIWHRRYVLGFPRSEWTQDPVLKRNKFTNIYRELDPGTVFCRTQILEREDESCEDRVFNVMLYRLMCSIPTYSGWGFQRVAEFHVGMFEAYLHEIYRSGRPVFGNAYLISPYSSMGSDYKFINVARVFGLIQGAFQHGRFFEKLNTAPTFEKAYKVLNSQYGFGPFLAYQVLVDLTYPLPDTAYGYAILPLGQNDWAKLGPGAIRGFGRVSSSYDRLKGLKWLQRNQRAEFNRLGVDFPFLVEQQKDGTRVEVEISLANLQNCFCEYHKYRSIQQGTGKNQRIFVPSNRDAVSQE